jgi:hypothetical protein
MIYDLHIPLPDHMRFLSLYHLFDGRWSMGLAASYELLSSSGSSLGGVVATGYGLSVEEARVAAIDKLQANLEERKNRPPAPLPTLGKSSLARNTSAFGEKSVDDILALLGVKK